MPSDIDLHLQACFLQLGRLRLFTQLFESELRDEFVFNDTTQAFWHGCLPLLRIAAGPLDAHLEVLREEPAQSARPKYADYLDYFYHAWDAAHAETAEGGASGVARRAVDRLFAALGHLLDARYALRLWMAAFAESQVTPCGGEDADFAAHACALPLEGHWQGAERQLREFRGDDAEAGFRLHLIGRKIFLTALAVAVVDPPRFQAVTHGQAIHSLRSAVALALSEFHRTHLQHKLARLEELTPRRFEALASVVP